VTLSRRAFLASVPLAALASATTVMADVAGQSFATTAQVVAGVTLVARRPARAPPLA